MTQLVFKAPELKRIVDHALAAKAFGKGYGDAAGDIILVHDAGIYLMSNGVPGDILKPPNAHYVAYAKGCNPAADASAYDTARRLVGGDDFAEYLPWAKPIKEAIDAGARSIIIHFNLKKLSLSSAGGKK